MSPGVRTPLLSWCLFSAAYAASPAEEEGKRKNKRAGRKRGGGEREESRREIKLIKKLNKRRKCDEQGKQELLVGRKDDTQRLGAVTPTGLVLGQPARALGTASQPQPRQPANGLLHTPS